MAAGPGELPRKPARRAIFKLLLVTSTRRRTTLTVALAAAALAVLAAMALPRGEGSTAVAKGGDGGVKQVIYVGNNWDGTAHVIDASPPHKRLGRLNIIPDYSERLAEIVLDPDRDKPGSPPYSLAIRQLVGEGNDQYVDDMFSTHDGRNLIVSRPSFRDVISLDIATGTIDWQFEVVGYRADHMAISPDGEHVAVSASTGDTPDANGVGHILDVDTGEEVGRFESGDSPHENNYSADGKRIFHASIGTVYTPTDQPEGDSSKGDRFFQIVRAKPTGDPIGQPQEIIERLDMGEELAEAGYPDMSSAVRPMAISPRERKVYFQVSFFHGYVVYNFVKDRVTRVVNLPKFTTEPKENYLLDSAHHGIARSGNGRKLCVAGTMDDYAAIVSTRTTNYKLLQNEGTKPYWSTTSENGRQCYVSWSGTDEISIISYRRRREIKDIPVGDHPQRVREGVIRHGLVAGLPGPDTPPPATPGP